MEHGIISYIIDDDDVHMVNTEKQIHNRIRCLQYHQYQVFIFLSLHVINIGIPQSSSISCLFSIEEVVGISKNDHNSYASTYKNLEICQKRLEAHFFNKVKGEIANFH